MRRHPTNSRHSHARFALTAVLSTLILGSPAYSQCTEDWLPGEGIPGVTGDLAVVAATTFDPDGPGPRSEVLVIGGGFSAAGDILTYGIAFWDNNEWSSPGGGMNGRVWALSVYDGDLIAAGEFTDAGGVPVNGIARWDGTTWHPMGVGPTGPAGVITELTVYNGELIAGGRFTTMDGVTVNGIAAWNGSAWHDLGGGVGPTSNGFRVVSAITVFEGDLIVGGGFSTVGAGVAADNVARWNGSTWQGLNDSYDVINVNALHVYNGELVASGTFVNASSAIDFVVRWTGANWQELGTGTSDHVNVFTVYNGELIAGGIFTNAGGVTAIRIARWNGVFWSSLGFGMGPTEALAVYGGDLYIGGLGFRPSGVQMSLVIRWNGFLADYVGDGIDGAIYDFETYNGDLIAAGSFFAAGEAPAISIARRVGDVWDQLGSPEPNGDVTKLVVFDGDLLACGGFTSIGGVSTPFGVARWDGQAWHAFGTSDVSAFLLHEGVLYAAGNFGTNQRVASWNTATQAWQPIGPFQANVGITCLTFFNGDLIAAGGGAWRWDFDAPGTWQPLGQQLGIAQTLGVFNGELLVGGYMNYGIMRFDGTMWVPLGGGLFLSNDLPAEVLAVFDLRVYNGELIVAGSFGHAGEQQYLPGSVTAHHIVRWNGESWLAFDGLQPGTNDGAIALHEQNGELIVGGWFDMAGGQPNGHIARWAPINPGDLDGDQDVDLTDLATLLSNFGTLSGVSRTDGDLDGDGDVDLNDLATLLARFGSTC